MLTTALASLRTTIRSLRRSPGFFLIAVFTLAMGIGANAALFTVLNAVLLRPLPYPESERIMGVSQTAPGIDAPPRSAGCRSLTNSVPAQRLSPNASGPGPYTLLAISLTCLGNSSKLEVIRLVVNDLKSQPGATEMLARQEIDVPKGGACEGRLS